MRGIAAVLGAALAAALPAGGCLAPAPEFDADEDLLRVRRRVRRRARGDSADDGRATAAVAGAPMAQYRCPAAPAGTPQYRAWPQRITEPAVCPHCDPAAGCLPLLLRVSGAAPAAVGAGNHAPPAPAPERPAVPVGADERPGRHRR